MLDAVIFEPRTTHAGQLDPPSADCEDRSECRPQGRFGKKIPILEDVWKTIRGKVCLGGVLALLRILLLTCPLPLLLIFYMRHCF